MENLSRGVHEAYAQRSGPMLSTTLDPTALSLDPDRLNHFVRGSSEYTIAQDIRSSLLHPSGVETVQLSKAVASAWVEVYTMFWRATAVFAFSEDDNRRDLPTAYKAWRDLTNVLIKGYSSGSFESWTVPCLYVVGRFLRIFAIKADAQTRTSTGMAFNASGQEDAATSPSSNSNLEDAARVINRVFTLCISDRAPMEDSRKWGLYYIANLLFKTYFKLNAVGLSKNILRAIQAAQNDMPSMESFPKSHVVTFKYYVGVIYFLEESYERAEENLADALNLCQKRATRNRELILTYLIPCRLLTTHTLPTAELLSPFPRLEGLFTELCRCIKKGDLAGFDQALAAGEGEFVKRRIYLTLERGRDIALRNLLRKVYMAGGFEEQKDGALIRRSRVPIPEFAAAIKIGTNTKASRLTIDEVECLLANMIYKNLIKGYISHERGIAVLSKGNAFPGTRV